MRKLAPALILFGFISAASAAEAPVVLVTVKCKDLFVVATGDKRFALLEWYGGYKPEKGDVVTGEFNHYGVQDMVVGNQRLRVWVDDYDLTQGQINEKLEEKCD